MRKYSRFRRTSDNAVWWCRRMMDWSSCFSLEASLSLCVISTSTQRLVQARWRICSWSCEPFWTISLCWIRVLVLFKWLGRICVACCSSSISMIAMRFVLPLLNGFSFLPFDALSRSAAHAWVRYSTWEIVVGPLTSQNLRRVAGELHMHGWKNTSLNASNAGGVRVRSTGSLYADPS
jgi:hypothetical protein